MEDSRGVHDILIVWRGKKFDVQMSSNATLKELGDEMQKMTNVKADTMRFIVPQTSHKSSKLLTPFSNEHERLSLQETSIVEGKPIRMMGVSENEVDEILQGENLNLRIAGFDEEEKRLRQRMSHRPQFVAKLPQGAYIFCDFRTLQLPGIELKPPPSEALRRMHMLASDPGIVAIMNKHRWRVGIMTEMAPVGYVGVSPKCILGFNKNQGEEISLRLRTDDLKGFRKYESIKKTLLHELAHMVYSEHDANFFALDSQLNKEANSLDWTRSTSHTLNGAKREEFDDEEFDAGEDNTISRKLGGNNSDQFASARLASVVAAYQRVRNYSTNNSGAPEVNEEPDPDDSDFHSHEDHTQMDHVVNEKLGSDNLNEPDPDDVSDFDVAQVTETASVEADETDHRGSVVALKRDIGEPNSSSEETMILDSEAQGQKNIDEPDPDELVAKPADDQSHQSKDYRDPMQTEENSEMQINEPDPDDEELRRIRDPVKAACDRFVKAIELLRTEVGLAQSNVVLQTLFKIISNVIEHPDQTKFRRLRKANPAIQRTIAQYKASMELLALIGFKEEIVSGEMGNAETYLVLKRNDPGFLWLAKSCVEMNISA